jgi:hypothetical protein
VSLQDGAEGCFLLCAEYSRDTNIETGESSNTRGFGLGGEAGLKALTGDTIGEGAKGLGLEWSCTAQLAA